MKFENPVVIGSGSWGTALAIFLARKCPQVHLIGRDEETAALINRTHCNKKYLPKAPLPENLIATTNQDVVKKADLVLFVVPTSATRITAEKLSALGIPESAVLLSCAKGIERETGKRMSQIIEDSFPKNPIAVLSGPNHAEEIAQGLPAAATVAPVWKSEKPCRRSFQTNASAPTPIKISPVLNLAEPSKTSSQLPPA
jgi:glycerol-3-phosphate dehydrogenase (NAD(P)+)